MKNKTVKFIGNCIFYFVLIAIVFILITPKIFGYSLYSVLSGSMTGAISTGSVVAVKAIDPKEIKTSDVITFKTDGGSIATHRVIDLTDDNGLAFVTKGDANENIDPVPIKSANVIGKVIFHIPVIGYFIVFIQNNMDKLLILLPTIFVILIGIKVFIDKKKKSNNEIKSEEL